MNRKLLITFAFLILIGGLFLVARTLAAGNGSEVCPNPIQADIGGSENSISYTAPSDNQITGVCIKSGEKMFGGNQHSGSLGNGTHENNCYRISGVGTQTVTVERVREDNDCQGLSHIDVFYSSSTMPTASPTTSPTITPAPGGGDGENGGNGGSTGGVEVQGAKAPMQQVQGLSSTDSGNNIYPGLVQLLAAAVLTYAGLRLFNRYH